MDTEFLKFLILMVGVIVVAIFSSARIIFVRTSQDILKYLVKNYPKETEGVGKLPVFSFFSSIFQRTRFLELLDNIPVEKNSAFLGNPEFLKKRIALTAALRVEDMTSYIFQIVVAVFLLAASVYLFYYLLPFFLILLDIFYRPLVNEIHNFLGTASSLL